MSILVNRYASLASLLLIGLFSGCGGNATPPGTPPSADQKTADNKDAADKERARDIELAQDNLRELARGMLLFNDEHNQYPAAASYDTAGKPLLSWRVHLLPHLGESALHKQFHLDEPWDSGHNRALVSEMPACFHSPGPGIGEGKTCFLVPIAGKNQSPFKTKHGEPFETVFFHREDSARRSGLRSTLAHMTDGLHNTIILVEASPDRAVIWTKPDDLEIDAAEPRTGLFGRRPGVVLTAVADAAIIRVPESVKDETLLRLFCPNDGKPIEGLPEGSREPPPDDLLKKRSKPDEPAKKN